MIILNKKGTAKITVSKSGNRIVPQFSSTKLYAHFKHFEEKPANKISPVWFVECDHQNDYLFEESNDGMRLEISTDCEHTGDIIKVTLADRENNYIRDSVELRVQTIC